jgi:hypothetical protein
MQNSETDNIRTAQPRMLIPGNYGDRAGLPPKLAEMTALWQKDRITGRLIKAIVGAFKQALRVKPA